MIKESNSCEEVAQPQWEFLMMWQIFDCIQWLEATIIMICSHPTQAECVLFVFRSPFLAGKPIWSRFQSLIKLTKMKLVLFILRRIRGAIC